MPVSSSHLEQPHTLEKEQPTEAEALPMALPLRRIARFVSLVLLILLTVNGFVCATWSYFFALPGWVRWQAIPALPIVAFIATTILGFRISNPLLRSVYAVSAAWLGALNFAFFAAAASWIGYGVDLAVGAPLPRLWIGLLFFGLAALAGVYGLINASWIRETKITVALPNLPKAWEGRTAALVTDLHLGHISTARFLRRVISKLRAAQPDVVFISGDMFDGSTVGLNRLAAPWKDYSAPRGIFYATGNHDELAERGVYLKAVAGTGIRVLNNEKIVVDGLQIVGIHDSEAGDPAELRSILRRAQLDPSGPSILLAHRPENLAVVAEEGVSLQLSGHTHRGQLWPWTMLVGRIYGPFAYGLHRLGKLLVYTSSGVGTWGPPLRVGTQSEIVLIRLEKA
jgi:predicted MPP superfamily phosphohydrolase